MTEFDVLVPFRSDNGPRQEIWDWVEQRWVHLFGDAHIILADSDPSKEFNRSQARNNAFRQSNSEIVVFADADVIPMPHFVQGAVKSAEMRPTLAYRENRYYNLAQEDTELILGSDPTIDCFEPERWEFCVTSWASMIAINHKHFESIGGYDENFLGWAYEDSAFNCAVKAYYGGFNRMQGFISHIWHPYTKESTWENPHFASNQSRFIQYQWCENSEYDMKNLQHRLGSKVF